MKEFALCLSLCLSLLLTACATLPGGGASVSNPPPSSQGEAVAPAAEPQAAKLLCRVIDGEEEGTLLLAEQGEGLYSGQGVYTLPLSACTLTLDGADTTRLAPQNGALVEVQFDGTVLETYPAQFGGPVTLNLLSQGRDDLCRLYLDVLEDLWEVDSGLNENLTELGIDLSKTRLSPAERSAVAWAFAQGLGLTPVEGSWQELVEQGYITATALGSDAPEDAKFYEWQDGLLLSITEQEGAGTENASTLAFDAQKWRSSLGAYFFGGCAATRSQSGQWEEYTIGSQAIS